MRAKILVPLDGSEVGDRILSFVDRLPGRADLQLVLLRAVGPEDDAQAAASHLRARRAALQQAGIRTVAWLAPEEPARAILEAAAVAGVGLVTMATHGEGGVRETVRGSVAEEILRTCPLPLLMGNVRSLPLDPASGFARILVPLDGTEVSASVLPMVGSIARQSGSEVVLFHAQPDPDPSTGPLERWADELRGEGVAKIRLATASGEPAAEILDAIDREPADLLAMTSHSRNAPGSPRRWFGSTAETVLSRAGCPILIHRVVAPVGSVTV